MTATRFSTLGLFPLAVWVLLAGPLGAQAPGWSPYAGGPAAGAPAGIWLAPGVYPASAQVVPVQGAAYASYASPEADSQQAVEHCDSCTDGCDECSLFGSGRLLGGAGLWRIRGDYLYIQRQVSDYVIFSRSQTDNTGPVVLDRSSIDIEPENGFRIGVERLLGKRNSVEGVFYGVQDWDSLAIQQDPSNLLFSELTLPGGNPVPGFDEAYRHELEFSSDFYNFELNLWRPCARKVLGIFDVSLMFGMRYVMLDEKLSYRGQANVYNGSPSPNLFAEVFTETANDIYALQLGWLVTAPLRRSWMMRWDGKVGGGVNFASQYTRLDENLNPVLHSEMVRTDAAAIVGDSLLTINWQVTCHLTLYVGYQVVFIEGVALAPEQFNPLFSSSRTPTLNHNGFVFMQAGVCGAEVVW